MDRGCLAVVFDLFGTLVPAYPHHAVLTEMAAVLGMDMDRLSFIAAFVEDTRDRRETGQFESLEENLRFICDRLGREVPQDRLHDAVRIRRDFTRASLTPREHAMWALGELRGRGLPVGIISDCCEVVPPAWRESPFASHVDVAIFSCEVGVKKPNPKIYQRACDALGARPSRCLYVGDGGSDELSGAVGVGMEAVLLAVPGEEGIDPYRPGAATWKGRTIGSLREVLDIARR